jgi:hypothetical protein
LPGTVITSTNFKSESREYSQEKQEIDILERSRKFDSLVIWNSRISEKAWQKLKSEIHKIAVLRKEIHLKEFRF